MRRLLLTVATTIIASSTALAGQFGEFVGQPHGRFINGPDRPLFKLDDPFVYRDPNGLEWTAPAGEVIDGASIPKPAWSLVGGPFSGKYLNASIIHDYYCCSKGREYYSTHHAFWLGMLAAGVGRTKANIMWAAVRFLGPEEWTVDLSASPPRPCKTEALELANLYDTATPENQSKAVAKLTAMARTLETTDGAVLDVVHGRIIESQSPEAEDHLAFLRKALLGGFDATSSEVGLISGITQTELEKADLNGRPVAPWVQGQIPALDVYMRSMNLNFPEPAKLDGSVYSPAVTSGYSNYNSRDFPVDFLDRNTKFNRQ